MGRGRNTHRRLRGERRVTGRAVADKVQGDLDARAIRLYGPNGVAVRAMLDRLQSLSLEELVQLDELEWAPPALESNAPPSGVRGQQFEAARDMAMITWSKISSDGALAGSSSLTLAMWAAGAVSARDLMSDADYQALVGPWERVAGTWIPEARLWVKCFGE